MAAKRGLFAIAALTLTGLCMADSALAQEGQSPAQPAVQNQPAAQSQTTPAVAAPVEPASASTTLKPPPLLDATTQPNSTQPSTTQPFDAEEILVTATRTPTPADQIGSSYSVIKDKEINDKQRPDVPDLLRDVSGVDIVRSGGKGQITSIFTRGSESRHTLILMDGIKTSDPSNPARTTNLNVMTSDNIEQIEVLKGPQSSVWGADAIGGAINLISKRGKGTPTFSLYGEGGSFSTAREGFSSQGSNDTFYYSVAASRIDTESISAADANNGNTERDRYGNVTASTRMGWTPADNFDVDFVFRYGLSQTGYDGGFPLADQANSNKLEELFMKFEPRFFLLDDDSWEAKVKVGYYNSNRKQIEQPATVDIRQDYHGDRVQAGFENIFRVIPLNTITVGFDYEKESTSSPTFDGNADTFSGYIQDQINFGDRLFITLGGRADGYTQFGTQLTYRAAVAYQHLETLTTLRGSYGTGFRAPSLSELYGPFGSPLLSAEKSAGWDLGVDQSFYHDDRLVVGATYFNLKYTDLLTYPPPTFVPQNIDSASSNGVETFVTWKPIKQFSARAQYTYTDTRNDVNNGQLLRRPRNKAGIDLNTYLLDDKLQATLQILYVGEREDFGTRLGSYTLVNLYSSYQITKNIQVFGRIENLTDQDYEEVSGFGTPGLSAYGGVKVTF